METNVTTGKITAESLLKGIKVAADAMRISYGPKGLNGVIERDINPGHEVANDAFTLVQAMRILNDSVTNIGLNFAKELMAKADSTSADGRKTTLLIATQIIEEALKLDLSGMEIKRELDALIPTVEAEIDSQKQLITENEVEGVATIASESKRIGGLLNSIYKVIGKDGIVHVEGSGTYQDDIKFIEGVRFHMTGFLSPYMVHDEQAVKDGRKETQAVYENPVVLVTKRKIAHINDINPLLETIMVNEKYKNKALVIFTDDMDSNVASLLIDLHKSKKLNVLIIKAPILWKNYIFEDFAKITGSTIIEDATGLNFKNLPLSALGTCGKIIVDKEETTVTEIDDISSHVEELKKEGTYDSKLRLSWLQTKTAILKLGANSESELSYLRLKAADGINSSKLALKDGVVIGGGYCLHSILDKLPDTVAGNILKKALDVPFSIIGNEDPNIKDASIVVKNAVRNAVSLASTILTLGIAIHTPQMSEQELVLAQLSAKQRPY